MIDRAAGSRIERLTSAACVGACANVFLLLHYIPRIIVVTIDYSLDPTGEVTVTPQFTEQQCGELPTGSSLIPTRLRHEKEHHDARGVEADGLREAAPRIAAEPGVAAAFDQPLFGDGPPVGFLERRTGDAAALDWPVEVASRER